MGTKRAGSLLLTTAMAIAMGSGSALAQEGEVVVDQPPTQSGVDEGEEVTVSGSGCPANSEVDIDFNNSNVASGTAGADGSFSLSFTVPDLPEEEEDVEEPSEASIRVECGGEVGGVVVAVNQVESGSDGTLPSTGVPAASLAGLSLIVALAGLALILATRTTRSE